MKMTHPAFTLKSAQIISALFGLFALLLLPLDTGKTEFAKALTDALHGPLFAAVAIVSLQHLKGTPQYSSQFNLNLYVWAFLITIVLGIIGEIAQYLFTSTRYAELKDVMNDSFGAIAGLSLHARQDRKPQPGTSLRHLLLGLGLTAVTAVLTPVAWTSTFYIKRWSQTPELATFESDAGFHFLHAGNAEIRIAATPSTWSKDKDKAALYIIPGNRNRWAGITLEEPLPDWSQYKNFVIEIINPHNESLELNVRIDDRQHNQVFNDRFNRTLKINPQTRTLFKIPISEISSTPTMRRMDIQNITKLVLFTDTQRNSYGFYLCTLKLE